MAVAQLGDLAWRIDPSAINWSYQIDANRIETLGGQVVQLLGATLSDLTITGYFGQDRANRRESWELAVAFTKKIQQMMDAQTLPAKTGITRATKASQINDVSAVHRPVQFSYQDGKHNWPFRVLIKDLTDSDGNGSLSHSTAKFSYGYRLTLFIVEDGTDVLTRIAKDAWIARLSKGIGWKQTKYNGAMSATDVTAFLTGHGGSVSGFLSSALTGGGG